MRKILITLLTIISISSISAQSFEIKSLDKRIQLTVIIDEAISWSVALNKNVIIKNSKAGMDFSSGPDFGVNPKVKRHSIKNFSSMIYPAVPHKDAAIKDEFVELKIVFKNSTFWI